MADLIKIAVDAMGGDNSPKKVMDGIIHNHKKNKKNFFKIFGDKSKIISLVKDAVFIYPGRYENEQEYVYETLEIDFDGDGISEQTEIRGRYLDENELIFTNEKPYVIYGYAAVDNGKELIIEKGSRIHFHDNSGLIITNGGSIKANGEFSQNQGLENEIIFEGDRLEPFFENIPGQWGTIWLLEGSIDNEFSFCSI